MPKKVLALLVVVLVAVFLTGCNQGGGNTTTSIDQTITLQWWGAFWEPEVVQSLIDEYESDNPNVKIEYANRWPGGSSEVGSKLYQDELDRVLKENNQAAIPDIFMVQNTWVGNYERYTAPAPVSVIDANTVKTAFYPAVAKDFANADVVRGLPLWMDSLAVIYNKTMLAQIAVSTPPTNWPDFKNVAIQLTKRSGGVITQAGFAAGLSSNVSFGPELLQLLMVQNGVAMTDGQGNAAFSTDGDSLTALDFYKSFAQSTGTWNADQHNDALAFLEGKLAMLVAPSWRYYDILQFNKLYDLGLEIGVAAMPQLVGQSQPVLNWADYWGAMVSVARPNSTASWEFLRWLSEPDQLEKLRQNQMIDREFFGFLYPRVDMQQELQADQYLRVYNSALPTAQTWYMVDGLAVRNIFKELLSQTSTNASNIAEAENDIQQVIDDKGQL